MQDQIRPASIRSCSHRLLPGCRRSSGRNHSRNGSGAGRGWRGQGHSRSHSRRPRRRNWGGNGSWNVPRRGLARGIPKGKMPDAISLRSPYDWRVHGCFVRVSVSPGFRCSRPLRVKALPQAPVWSCNGAIDLETGWISGVAASKRTAPGCESGSNLIGSDPFPPPRWPSPQRVRTRFDRWPRQWPRSRSRQRPGGSPDRWGCYPMRWNPA